MSLESETRTKTYLFNHLFANIVVPHFIQKFRLSLLERVIQPDNILWFQYHEDKQCLLDQQTKQSNRMVMHCLCYYSQRKINDSSNLDMRYKISASISAQASIYELSNISLLKSFFFRFFFSKILSTLVAST